MIVTQMYHIQHHLNKNNHRKQSWDDMCSSIFVNKLSMIELVNNKFKS